MLDALCGSQIHLNVQIRKSNAVSCRAFWMTSKVPEPNSRSTIGVCLRRFKEISSCWSRGHSSLTVQENGEIFVQTKENETEPAKEAFLDFPEKVYWPQLVKVLESEGYAADARDADILVSW